ncbi:hypothetical protein ACWOFS_06275 [Abiotrophia defectiva]
MTKTRHGQNRVRVVPQDAKRMRSSGSASDLELPELGKAEDSRREAAAGPTSRA